MDSGGSITTRALRNGRADWRMHALSVFSLSVAFVCLAGTLVLLSNLEAIRERWARVGRATVYLREDVDQAQTRALQDALARTPGVTGVRFVSPEDARREIVQDAADAALASLPAQAFPAALDVAFAPELGDAEVQAIAGKVKAVPGVDGVDTYARWSERLGTLVQGCLVASGVLAIVVLGAVASVVASTMRMALERRRTEVEVLRLVGATDAYVRGPFVVEGAAEGALGAAIAVALVGLLYALVRARFEGELGALLGVAPAFLSPPLALGIVVLGGGLGAISSAMSLRTLAKV